MTMRFRWYRFAVFALWLSAITWLTVRKILPPFFKGEPPGYETAASDLPRPPVGWNLYLDQTCLGWALSESTQQSTDTTEIHSLIHFDRFPLEKLLPFLLRQLVLASLPHTVNTEMEVESHLLTNTALNQLVSFESKFRPKGGQSYVKINGDLEGDKLKLSVHLPNFDNPNIELPMPDARIRDSFSPEMELHDLHLNQSWTIISYSPMAVANRPLDMIQGRPPTEVLFARVEDRIPFAWNGRTRPTWLVVYRSEADEGPGSEKSIRNRLWVRRDGTVVKQEVTLGEHQLRFIRMSDEDAIRLGNGHGDFSKQPRQVFQATPAGNHD